VITFITHLRVSRANAAAFEALLTDMCVKCARTSRACSPGTEPVRRNFKLLTLSTLSTIDGGRSRLLTADLGAS
jgi:hypothetical protein